MVSDFAVIIAIFSMSYLDNRMGINTPKLMVNDDCIFVTRFADEFLS
jgi:solute carrier family 4 (sodium bicarbonate transporter), member 10